MTVECKTNSKPNHHHSVYHSYEVNRIFSLFPTPDSRFPTPNSRFPIPDSRFPTPYSLLPDSLLPVPFSLCDQNTIPMGRQILLCSLLDINSTN
ncbi:MAG: hypothetical protein F6J94_08115 [Moorea sp. SIO1F2]|uniref:hypothetical protein n=1 Tax=Moorena sp. SIO1F2 TaxID=2607819 RepID=UPI0013B83E4F|nr:hypothetical protein [Moorena sp. SIO1F2]NET81907.1 hypothetical protein [Moorena sp. SIO1F2]